MRCKHLCSSQTDQHGSVINRTAWHDSPYRLHKIFSSLIVVVNVKYVFPTTEDLMLIYFHKGRTFLKTDKWHFTFYKLILLT